MHTDIYINIHIHIIIYMYVHIPMYLYKCSSLNQMDINAQMHVYIYTHGYAHTSIFPFENVCVYIHVYTCINVSLPCIASAMSEKSFCASISVANCTEEGSSTALVLCERVRAFVCVCVCVCVWVFVFQHNCIHQSGCACDHIKRQPLRTHISQKDNSVKTLKSKGLPNYWGLWAARFPQWWHCHSIPR